MEQRYPAYFFFAYHNDCPGLREAWAWGWIWLALALGRLSHIMWGYRNCLSVEWTFINLKSYFIQIHVHIRESRMGSLILLMKWKSHLHFNNFKLFMSYLNSYPLVMHEELVFYVPFIVNVKWQYYRSMLSQHTREYVLFNNYMNFHFLPKFNVWLCNALCHLNLTCKCCVLINMNCQYTCYFNVYVMLFMQKK